MSLGWPATLVPRWGRLFGGRVASAGAATLAQFTVMLTYGNDDGLGRGAHKASENAQIEAGLVRFKTGEHHRSLTVRAKRTLAGSLAMEKRGNGTIEHDASLGWALSVTDSCRDGAMISPS